VTKPDPVKMATSISKVTKVPKPRVAQVMQKYPLTREGMTKAYDECLALGVKQMQTDLKGSDAGGDAPQPRSEAVWGGR
jgi:hypothetical protein